VAIVAGLVGHEPVHICVGDEALEEAARRALHLGEVDPDRYVRFHRIPSDDAWMRDHGPLFVVRGDAEERERAVIDFGFDNWGRKYPGWQRDAAVARRVAEELRVPRFASEFVLEGGAIDGDGAGSVLTTESCLLHGNRGTGRTRERAEQLLRDFLGVEQVLWLAAGIEGDDTDGHVDDVARFVGTSTVVTVVCEDPADANYAPLTENRRRLERMRDAHGRPLDIVPLPSPPPRRINGARCPESYANFYLANGVALAPTFGAPTDVRALAVLRELLAGREVVGIPCADLVIGLGTVHCVTQQEPL
jgi:agmatine deiminase